MEIHSFAAANLNMPAAGTASKPAVTYAKWFKGRIKMDEESVNPRTRAV